MAIGFFWRCEGTTLDGMHDFSAGDTTATAVGSPAIDGAAARVGSNGILINALGESYDFAPASIIAGAEGALGFWFRPTTWTGDSVIFQARSAAGHEIRIAMSGTDEISFLTDDLSQGSHSLVTTAADLVVGNWYFIVVRWHDVNGDKRLEIYNTSLALIQAVEDLAVVQDAMTLDQVIHFGEIGSAGATYHLDNIFIGSTYAEPFVNWATITSFTEYGKTPIPAGLSKFELSLVANDDHFQAEMTDIKHWF